MAISYLTTKAVVKVMLDAIDKGPPDNVAAQFDEAQRATVKHTAFTALLPIAVLAGQREGLSTEEVLNDLAIEGLYKVTARVMLDKLVPPLIRIADAHDKEDETTQSFKRKPSDDVAATLFRAVSKAMAGAFDVLNSDEDKQSAGLSEERWKGAEAGIISLAGAIVHALHHETGVSENKLYPAFNIPPKYIPMMQAASEATKILLAGDSK